VKDSLHLLTAVIALITAIIIMATKIMEYRLGKKKADTAATTAIAESSSSTRSQQSAADAGWLVRHWAAIDLGFNWGLFCMWFLLSYVSVFIGDLTPTRVLWCAWSCVIAYHFFREGAEQFGRIMTHK